MRCIPCMRCLICASLGDVWGTVCQITQSEIRPQNPLGVFPCGFESHPRHHSHQQCGDNTCLSLNSRYRVNSPAPDDELGVRQDAQRALAMCMVAVFTVAAVLYALSLRV